MKKSLLSFFRSILLVSLVFASGAAFAQTTLYDEGVSGDLPGTGSGTALTISSAGTYIIKGNLSTPGDQQDRYTLTVNSGLQITQVDYSLAAPGSFNGFLEFDGNDIIFSPGSGSGTYSFSYPLAAGSYFGLNSASFSVGNNWQITVTVTSSCIAPAITSNPSNSTLCAGSTVNLTSAASGTPSPTVQWQKSTDGGATYNNIVGATSATLSFATVAADNGNKYRAVYTNGCGSATTTAATLTVNSAPSVTTNPTNQTLCAGGTATFTAAASGLPAPTVQWQKSTDGGATYNNVAGATATTLSFATVAGDNASLYRAVFTNACGTATTTAATLTVNTAPFITANPSSTVVCPGTTATFTASASGQPVPTVQWQLSTDGGATYNNIVGATSTTYSFTAIAANDGNRYRAVFTNTCGSATTNPALLTMNVAPAVASNPGNQTLCVGATATFTASASGTPSPTVQWQKSTDGGATYNNIAGATATTLSFVVAGTDNGSLYRAVFTNTCNSATTTAATLTVTSPLITSNPANVTTCAPNTASFSATASGTPAPTIQWQVSTDGGATWGNIGAASGGTLGTYFVITSPSNNGYQYRAVFTNTCGSLTSNAATLTVNTIPSVTTQPTDQAICSGATVNFTATAAASPAATIQWQKTTNGGVTWNNIVGATSSPLSFVVSPADNGTDYRAVFSNSCGSTTSTAAQLLINSVTIAINPTSQTVCAGNSVTFTSASAGTPSSTVQWQVSTDGGATWNNVAGATSVALNFVTTAAQNGNQYRAVFTNTCGSATTTAATLNVNSNAISTQPTDQTICSGNSATFTTVNSGLPVPTVQWQFSTDNGSTWNNLPGATSPTLVFPGSYGNNAWKFRAIYTNTCGTVTSSPALLNVNTSPNAPDPAPQSACNGTTVTFSTIVTGIPAPTLQWQTSTDGGVTWNNVAGATSAFLSFSVTNANNGSRYRIVCTNSCGTYTTSSSVLTVNNPATVALNPISQTACSGANVSFTVLPTSGTTPPPATQWQVSTDGGATWNNIGGATTNTYSIVAGPSNNNNQYRAVFSNVCGPVNTTAATLTVNGGPIVTTNPISQTICAGTTVNFTAAANGTPAPTVQWQQSTDGGVTWTNYPGATTTTLSFIVTTANQGNLFRAVFTNSCANTTSLSASLNVTTSPVVTLNPVSQTLCNGTVTFTSAATGTAVITMQWQLSTDGGATWTAIAGATNSSFTLPVSTGFNGWQFRNVFTNGCGSATTTAATLTVNTGVAITTNPTSQTICTGATATFTTAGTGSPVPTIQWQSSANNGAIWNDIGGANTNTYSITAGPGNNGWQFRAAYTNSCGTVNTTPATLTVTTPPAITQDPVSQTVCSGATVTYTSASTGTPAPTVQWMQSTDGGATWTSIAGATTTTLSFTTSFAQNGNRYEAVFTNGCGSATSASAPLNVNTSPVIILNPLSQVVCASTPVTFNSNVQSGTTPLPTVQWQSSSDGGATWNNIGGANSPAYNIIGGPGNNGWQFRAVYTNTCGSVITNPATLTVNTIASVTTNPVSQTICAGSPVTFTAASTGSSPAATVQWQQSIDGGVTYASIPGATATSFTFTTNASNNGYRYRAVFTNACGTATTLVALLNINIATSIVTNPVPAINTCPGVSFTLISSATGTPAPTAQWQKSTDGGATWNNIVGATNSNLTIIPALTDNGNMYRIVYNNSCGTATTTATTLTVNTPVAIVTNPVSVAICNGTIATFTAGASGSPTPTQQWQISTNGGATWADKGGATAPTFSMIVSTANNLWQIRSSFTNACGTVYTTAAILTVTTTPTITTSPVTQSICNGSSVTFTSVGTGTPVPTIQWQQSIDAGVTWTSIAGATAANLTFATNNSMDGYRYRAIYTNTCGFATTAVAILNMNDVPVVTNNPLSQAICNGATVTFSSYATGTPTPSMQWQFSTNGGVTWTNKGGANTNTYSQAVSTANNGWLFRLLFTNTCGSTPSAAATLTINSLPVVSLDPLSQAICAGTPVTFTAAGNGTPAPTVQWQRSVDFAATWGNIIGATSTTYTFTTSTLDNGYRYRAVFTNTCGSAITANAILNINTAPYVTTQPAPKEICGLTNTYFTFVATGTALTYQWQVNPGTGFVNISGAPYTGFTTTTLNVIGATEAMSGYTYRCLISGTCAPTAFTNVVALTVDTIPKVLTATGSVTVCEGNNATYAITAKGSGRYYSWQINNGSGWAYIKNNYPFVGVYTNTLTIMAAPAAFNGLQLRCVVAGKCTPGDTSTPASLTVNTAPKILNQTSMYQTICNTANDSFTVIATGTAITYQWQLSIDNGTTWNNMSNGAPYSGVTNPTLVITNASMSMNKSQYRCIVSGTCPPPDTSNVIIVTMTNKTSWTGAVDTKWSNPLNWSCGVLPLATTEVYVSQYVKNMPVVDISTAICDSITFGGTASLAFTGAAGTLTIKGSVLCGLCKFDASAGKVIYSGSNTQLVQASTYMNIDLNGAGNKVLTGGDATVTGNINLLLGNLTLNDNNVTLDNTASILGGSAISHFITNKSGIINVKNAGVGGKLGAQMVPLSDGSTYTPLTFTNTGANQTYHISVYNNVSSKYDKYFLPTGTAFTQYAVGKSWRLSTDVPDSSNVTLTLQWNANDELPNFNRNACYISSYSYPDWNAAPTITNSIGSGPYSLTMSGISNMTVFSVSSSVNGTIFRTRHGDVQLYPNPASTTLNLKFDVTPGRNVNVYILNMFGREVYRVFENPYNFTDGIIPVDVSRLAPGEYIVNVEDVDDNGEVRTARFVKP